MIIFINLENLGSIGGYYSSRESEFNNQEDNTNKRIELKKAQMKIREMEECLKYMNAENDNSKGKLGNVISHLNTPEGTHKTDKMLNNNKNVNNNENLKVKGKNKNFSSIVNNNTLEDLRTKFKNSNNINVQNAQLLNHQKAKSCIPIAHEDEDENENSNLQDNTDINENLENNGFQDNDNKRDREFASNAIRWNRHMTLGKTSSQNNLIQTSRDINKNNQEKTNNVNNFNLESNNNLISTQNPYKMNPFFENTANTFINHDFEKISNMDNNENIDNTNNLEEIEQMENEDDDGNYNVIEFPLQLKKKKKI